MMGNITCEITNSVVTGLTVYRKAIQLTINTMPAPTTCGIYQFDNVYIPSFGTNFYVSFRTNSAIPAGIIGLDYCLNYDPTLIVPTGRILKRNVFSSGTNSHASKRNYIDNVAGEMNMALYYDGDAPENKEFQGTGEIIRVQFTSQTNTGVSTNLGICGIEEGYLINVISHCLSSKPQAQNNIAQKSSFSFSKPAPLTLRAELRHWGRNQRRLRFDITDSSLYLPTWNSVSSNSCASTSNPILPNTFGNAFINFNTETHFHIDRDIPGDYIDSTNCNDVSSDINNKDAARILRIAVKDAGFNPNIHQIIAADVNLDGMVRANDATLAWRRNNGYICEFPQAWNYNSNGTPNGNGVSYDWLFFSEDDILNNPDYTIDTSYPSSSGTVFSRNLIPLIDNCLDRPSTVNPTLTKRIHGVLVGDVNGSWRAGDGNVMRQSFENYEVEDNVVNINNNPSNDGLFSINFKKDILNQDILNYKVINVLGVEFDSGSFDSNTNSTINLSNLPKGSYWLIIKTNDKVISKQLIYQ